MREADDDDLQEVDDGDEADNDDEDKDEEACHIPIFITALS